MNCHVHSGTWSLHKICGVRIFNSCHVYSVSMPCFVATCYMKQDMVHEVLTRFYLQGQGYSLPGDVQYVDARWEVPVVLPLRDCTAEDLNKLCHLDG